MINNRATEHCTLLHVLIIWERILKAMVILLSILPMLLLYTSVKCVAVVTALIVNYKVEVSNLVDT